MSLQRKDLYI